jgi:hypothetical protein
MDILSIPLYYIDSNKSENYEAELSSMGFTNVNHFPAIDGRKMKIKELTINGVVSSRAYNDVVYGRHQHTGISTMGTIGCFLSHAALWKMCVDKNMPYMCIAEGDVSTKTMSNTTIKHIGESLSTPNGAIISPILPHNNGEELLIGAHLYFITRGAAKELFNRAFPIDMQLDSYIGHVGNIGKINLTSRRIANPKFHFSATSDAFCWKCYMPNSLTCLGIIIFIITIIVFSGVYYHCG